MAAELKNYSPHDVTIVITPRNGPPRTITNVPLDNFISIAPNQPEANVVAGLHTAIVNRSADKSVVITMTLMPASADDAYFNGLRAAEAQFSIGVFVPRLGETGFAECATIINRPTRTYGTEAGNREVQIYAYDWDDAAEVVYEAIT